MLQTFYLMLMKPDGLMIWVYKMLRMIENIKKLFLQSTQKIIIVAASLLVFSCDSNECFYRPGTAPYKESYQIVRADGIRVPMGSHGNYGRIGYEDVEYNILTGLPEDKYTRGQWQDVSPIAKDKNIKISVTGDVYLEKIEQFVEVSFQGTSATEVDINGKDLIVAKDDLIIITKDHSGTMNFKSVAGFDSNYKNRVINSDSSINLPSDNTSAGSFIKNLVNTRGNDTDQKIISMYGFCREKYLDQTSATIQSYFAKPRVYPQQTSETLLNCFHYDGRGVQISMNNNTVLKDSKLPFSSTGAFVPSDMLSDPEKINNAEKTFYPFDYSIDKDPMIFEVIKIKNNQEGKLRIVLDKSFFAGAAEDGYIGGYRFKITRYTSINKNGQRMHLALADPGLDISNWTLDEVSNNSSVILRPPIVNSDSFIAPKNGKLWARIFDNNYNDNLDQYYLTLQQESGINTWKGVFNNFVTPLKRKLYKTVESTYARTVTNKSFQTIVKLMMILSLILYILSFLLGFVRESQEEFMKKLLKLGIVSILISDSSWNFFNNHLFMLFEHGTDQLLSISGALGKTAGPFDWMDNMMYLFLNDYLGIRLASLLVVGPFGIVMIIVMLYGVLCLLMITVRVFLIYCLMMICTAFLISLSPIFIACLLFKRTTTLFNQWWQLTGYFAFAPFLIIIGAVVIVYIIDSFADRILGNQICWNDTMYIYIYIFGFIKIKIATLRWLVPDPMKYGFSPVEFAIGGSADTSSALSAVVMMLKLVADMIVFLMLVKLIEHYVRNAEKLVAMMMGIHQSAAGASAVMDRIIGVGKSIAAAVMTGGKSALMQTFSSKKK